LLSKQRISTPARDRRINKNWRSSFSASFPPALAPFAGLRSWRRYCRHDRKEDFMTAKAKKTTASLKTTKAPSNRDKPGSKQDTILVLLRRPEGAGLDVLVKETGWQKHSVRGFLAGTVRKKLKLPLLSEKIDGVRNYRIGTAKAAKTTKTSTVRKA
jgi:Protein of unknown function (DUF3489)